MNKKLFGLIGVLSVISLTLFFVFILNNNQEENLESSNKDISTEEVVDEDNESDEVDETNEVEADESEDKDEYEELLEEVIGDDELTDEEMIEVAQDLIIKYLSAPEISDENELKEEIEHIFSNKEMVEALLVVIPESWDEPVFDTKVDFSNDTVLQVSKTEFEYSAVVKAENNLDVNLSNLIAKIEKTDGTFKIKQLTASSLEEID